MNNNETTKCEAKISYEAPRAIEIGDVFYAIVRGKNQYFYEPCKVCKGERKLTINEVTFNCPCCNHQKETLHIAPYLVHRYRVYSITDSVSNSDWKASTNHSINFKLYRKVGRGYTRFYDYDSGKTIEIRSDEFTRQYNAPYDDLPREKHGIYDDYKLAVSVAQQMTDYELNRLKEYNAEFGTSYEANFNIVHDPKSN